MKLLPLTEGDLGVCKMLAGVRTAANRRNETHRPFSTGYASHIAQEEEGIIAEYAFCKHYNIFFNGQFGGKDGGYDCIWRINDRDIRVDIKSISNRGHNLMAHGHTDKSDVDWYVLVYVAEDRSCEIMGWARKGEFILDEHSIGPDDPRNHGDGPCYFMKQGLLNKWGKKKDD